jgi:hypothetical protein
MLTKENILKCLDEIGYRIVRAEEDPQHYTNLCLAFSVAYAIVAAMPADKVELRAKVIETLGLAHGSVQ